LQLKDRGPLGLLQGYWVRSACSIDCVWSEVWCDPHAAH